MPKDTVKSWIRRIFTKAKQELFGCFLVYFLLLIIFLYLQKRFNTWEFSFIQKLKY